LHLELGHALNIMLSMDFPAGHDFRWLKHDKVLCHVFPAGMLVRGFILCACVVLTAMAEARSGEFHTKQSIAGDGHHIDHGGLLFHGNYCGPGSRQPSAGYSILASITAAVSGHDERQGAYL
jgi:hypothetical protein